MRDRRKTNMRILLGGIFCGLACAASAATGALELEQQFTSIKYDLHSRAAFAKIANETFQPEALIFDSDRDPADVVLRRMTALLADLECNAPSPKLTDLARRLTVLQNHSATTAITNATARRALFDQACQLRRQIAFANPLLDFDGLLFVKRHRGMYNHMCDQFYGITARPGGGLFVLKNPFSDQPEVRDVLAESTVANGRLKGQKLIGGNGATAHLSYDGVRLLSGDETQGGAFLSPRSPTTRRRFCSPSANAAVTATRNSTKIPHAATGLRAAVSTSSRSRPTAPVCNRSPTARGTNSIHAGCRTAAWRSSASGAAAICAAVARVHSTTSLTWQPMGAASTS